MTIYRTYGPAAPPTSSLYNLVVFSSHVLTYNRDIRSQLDPAINVLLIFIYFVFWLHFTMFTRIIGYSS